MGFEAIKEDFEQIILSSDPLEIRQFLDQQNISDVAELVYELPEYEARIIASMSVHRAAGVF
ncbi:MAG TPA: magnesium transporter, partial [Chitinophagaceae bacterium]|nr:magnesium transporter [Chitinophagaceae bacterium]